MRKRAQARKADAVDPRRATSDMARRIIDAAPGGPLGWIVGFAREDLPADLEVAAYLLLAFAKASGMWMTLDLSITGDAMVRAFHAELRQKLRELVSIRQDLVHDSPDHEAGDACIQIPAGGLVTSLIRKSGPGVKPAAFKLRYGGPWRTMLWQEVARLIAETDRLLACRFCGEPFLALRKAIFCGPKCAQRWHDREKVKAKQKGVAQ